MAVGTDAPRPTTGVDADGDEPWPAGPGWPRVGIVVLLVLVGIGLRVALLALRSGVFDSDEAVAGLMARHALDGEVGTFFWGQVYGGTIEPLLAAPIFALAGSSVLALRIVPIVLSAVAAVLTWRLGCRTVGYRAGVAAGLAMWVGPANLVWFSTRERGFYWVCLVLGLGFLLILLRVIDEPGRRWRWPVLGLVGGLLFWTSPQGLYFLVPGSVWLLVTARRTLLPGLLLAVPAAVIGAAPWLAFNLRNGWASIDRAPSVLDHGLLGNAWILLREGVPVVLGLRVYDDGWVPGPVTAVAYLALVAAAVAGLARRRRGTGLLLLAVACYVPVYASIPVSGVVGEGRYVLFLLPFLLLLLANAAAALRPWAPNILALAVAGLALATLPALDAATSPFAVDRRVPDELSPLLHDLEARGIQEVIADYWIAYRVTFESGEKVIAAPITNDRYPPFQRRVVGSDRPAWVFVDGSFMTTEFERQLAYLAMPYTSHRVGGFVVYQPEGRVICWPPGYGVPCS